MNGYLVLLRHSCDDLPVGLFEDYTEARRFARRLKPYPTRAVIGALMVECCTPCNVSIITFACGEPTECEIVKEFTDE